MGDRNVSAIFNNACDLCCSILSSVTGISAGLVSRGLFPNSNVTQEAGRVRRANGLAAYENTSGGCSGRENKLWVVAVVVEVEPWRWWLMGWWLGRGK